VYSVIKATIEEIQQRLAHLPQLAKMFAQCYPNTLETTISLLEDGSTFVVTGDIPAMWLRDSSAQVNPYICLAGEDADLRRMLRGLIQRQAHYILLDAYANAFNITANDQGHKGDLPPTGPWVWERKYELDSLCYPIKLCYDYWCYTRDESAFTETVHAMLRKIVEVMRTEQRHDERSSYSFQRFDPFMPADTLPCDGHGTPTKYTGMVWSGFRPSDDPCKFGYLVPANMFAVVVLGYLSEIARRLYQDEELAHQAEQLRHEIDGGIQNYATIDHPRYGRIYAYETDGYGNHNLMDDANVPSLLAIPYLGYRPANDPLYVNTRRFVLSADNPYYYQGRYARGVGSPHTPECHIWPIALLMQGLTSTSEQEQIEVLHMISGTTAGTSYMHESFDADDPQYFTRPWFAWANSLFGEFIYQLATQQPDLLTRLRQE
jgi:meiotically up-regulated gene 157 (Mug157) protein